jgi:hypothetical protein
VRIPDYCWSRREDLNTPSADYNSAALPLSYTSFEENIKTFEPGLPVFSVVLRYWTGLAVCGKLSLAENLR